MAIANKYFFRDSTVLYSCCFLEMMIHRMIKNHVISTDLHNIVKKKLQLVDIKNSVSLNQTVIFLFVTLYFYGCCHPCYQKNRQMDRQTNQKRSYTALIKIKNSQFYKVLSLLQFYGFDFYFSQHLFPLGVILQELGTFQNEKQLYNHYKITVFSFLIWAKYQHHQRLSL